MNGKIIAAVALVAVLVVGGILIAQQPDTQNNNGSITPTSTDTNTSSTSSSTVATTTNVKIALLDTEKKTDGVERGCDSVVIVGRTVKATTQPLNAALQELFGITTTNVGGWYNFIAKTNTTLKFDHATLTNGVAKIYLTGKLSGLSGVCDDPRAQIQIEETAKQFSTVQSVEMYLNGVKTILTPSER